MGLVSKAYYEDNGTLKGEDDYGYSELSEKFSGLFGSVKALKLDLFLDKIQVDEREAKLNFSYEIKFRISYPTGDRWAVESDKDQMVLKLEEGNWKIASGL